MNEDKISDCSFKHLVSRLIDMGVIKEKLTELLTHELFQKSSKHDSYWTVDEGEEENERLRRISCQVAYINDMLWQILEVYERND